MTTVVVRRPGIGLAVLAIALLATDAGGQQAVKEPPADQTQAANPQPTLKDLRRQLLRDINRARALTNMRRLQPNQQLQNSAQSHADYLARHGQIGHQQESNLPLFSGVWYEDRAAAAGYPSRRIWEIVSSNPADINGLTGFMTSVYHRLQILNPAADEAGVGISERGDNLIYVVNLGQSRWRQLCQRPVRRQIDPDQILLGQCADDRTAVPVGRVKSLNENVLRSQPAVILWPPDNYNGFPLQLTKEQPNPLPGRTRLGNPITVQFNIAQGNPRMEAWQLLELNGDALKDVAVEFMSAENDPHQLLGLGEYALVPVEPLNYGTKYRMRLKYALSDSNYRMEWNFATQPLPWPVLMLGGADIIWLEQGEGRILQLLGNSLQPEFKQIAIFSADRVRVEFERPMQNLLLARFSGKACGKARIQYAALPATLLQIKPPGNPEDPAEACRKRLEKSLPGIAVHGTGELLEMDSGKEYQVSLVPESDSDSIGRLRWAAPASCKVKTKFDSKLTSRIRIDCAAGKQVRFSLSKERFFQVRVR